MSAKQFRVTEARERVVAAHNLRQAMNFAQMDDKMFDPAGLRTEWRPVELAAFELPEELATEPVLPWRRVESENLGVDGAPISSAKPVAWLGDEG